MITYDYTLEQVLDKDGIKDIFRPINFDTTLSNLVYLKGPNSSGKSTILNILALGFYGQFLGEDEISKDLRERIEGLIKSKNQRIKFSISVKNERIGSTLSIEKPSLDKEEITVYKLDGDKRVSILPEDFFKEYKLIYDIPQNPLKRIDSILKEIRIEHKSVGLRIKEFRQESENLINVVRKTDNLKLMAELNEKIDQENNRRDTSEKEFNTKKNLIEDLNKFLICKMYCFYHGEFNRNEKELTLLRKKEKAYGNISKKISHQDHALQVRLTSLIARSSEFRQDISDNIRSFLDSKEMNYLTSLLELDISEVVKDVTKLEIINDDTEHLLKILRSKRNLIFESSKTELQKNEFFRQLIIILDNYKSTSITIPGINKQPDEFIQILKSEIEKNENVDLQITKLDDALNIFNGFQNLINQASQAYSDLIMEKERIGLITESGGIDHADIEKLDKRNHILSEKLKEYKINLGKLGISEDNAERIHIALKYKDSIAKFQHYSENELKERIYSINKEIERLKNEIDTSKNLVMNYENRLQDCKNQRPHKYLKNLKELENLSNLLRSMEQKFLVKFNEDFSQISKSSNINDLSDPQRKIAQSMSTYLAHKIPQIKHNETIHQIDSVDFISKAFITKSGLNIDYSYMGTGQAQSAYLSGLLNTNDDRKLIVLFDEVALMDDDSLNLVIEKLKNLYDQGKVLLGVIVKVDKEFSNVSLQ